MAAALTGLAIRSIQSPDLKAGPGDLMCSFAWRLTDTCFRTPAYKRHAPPTRPAEEDNSDGSGATGEITSV
jgi:hypothetical protein